jgi:small GTP-binding protein
MLGQRKVKCVCVGDAGVGKSSLLMAFATNTFLADTVPALCRNYNVSIVVNEIAYNIGLYDTQSDYVDRNEGQLARIATYAATDVVLLCFSAVNRNSFNNITARWTTEFSEHLVGIPVVLVCTNTDLRREDSSCVTYKEGFGMKVSRV